MEGKQGEGKTVAWSEEPPHGEGKKDVPPGNREEGKRVVRSIPGLDKQSYSTCGKISEERAAHRSTEDE